MRISDWSSDVCSSDLVPQGYNALKGALIVYAGQLSQALGPKGVRVNSVSPGPIKFPGGNWEAIKGAMPELDRKSVVEGKSVSVRVDLGGSRIIKQKNDT